MSGAKVFEKVELVRLLDSVLNKTLGEVDSKNVFDRTITSPKITGIAGNVIEQSVLDYPADNQQRPDLIVDEEMVEVKSTGIKMAARGEKAFVAKEPMTITAVSPDTITSEDFLNSSFWHKLERVLFIYYHYASKKTVPAAEYSNFFIRGYHFHEFSNADRLILKNDWELVRNFIQYLQENYEDCKSQYPRISSELRSSLLFIDTAPKWPNPPRFRLKRKVVTTIVQEHFNGSLEQLPNDYSSYAEIDEKCSEITNTYSGNTVEQLIKKLHINENKVNKSIGEQVVVKMFGGTAKKMKKIELFSKIGLVAKTITLTTKGLRTEDMKLFPINFDELSDCEIEFEDSEFYDYFANNQFLCIIFEEPNTKAPLSENKFIGFRRFVFSDDFIETHVKKVWLELRSLIFNNELKDIVEYDKNGKEKTNKTGVVSSAPNFPKSKTNVVFVRGSGTDSTNKTVEVNGIKMYKQYAWIQGKYITNEILDKK